jgi:hypothetical protein
MYAFTRVPKSLESLKTFAILAISFLLAVQEKVKANNYFGNVGRLTFQIASDGKS